MELASTLYHKQKTKRCSFQDSRYCSIITIILIIINIVIAIVIIIVIIILLQFPCSLPLSLACKSYLEDQVETWQDAEGVMEGNLDPQRDLKIRSPRTI